MKIFNFLYWTKWECKEITTTFSPSHELIKSTEIEERNNTKTGENQRRETVFNLNN